jgi:hypothetical protein
MGHFKTPEKWSKKRRVLKWTHSPIERGIQMEQLCQHTVEKKGGRCTERERADATYSMLPVDANTRYAFLRLSANTGRRLSSDLV